MEKEEWIIEKKLQNDKKYDRRFIYYETYLSSNPGTKILNRETRIWYKPIMWIGEKLKEFIYWYVEEYNKKGNSYLLSPYSNILWWIRKNVTFN